ncbi:MAG TPA: ComF family protein [Firmicutes bacterium]|nr:ComF family protein [Bacillota bacterium]
MSLLQTIFDLFFPPRCPFCLSFLAAGSGAGAVLLPWGKMQQEGALCPRCAAALPWLTGCCPRCARPQALPQGQENGCPSCRTSQLAFTHSCVLGSYQGALRQTLHRFKYGGEKSLAVPLGRLLASRISAMPWLPAVELLTAVPLALPRLRARGYNQAALLAGTVSRELGIPGLPLLERARDTASQTGLDRRQRWENMHGAFSCLKDNLQGKHILLVDDILTSGATAHAASLALKAGGASVISVAAIAR